MTKLEKLIGVLVVVGFFTIVVLMYLWTGEALDVAANIEKTKDAEIAKLQDAMDSRQKDWDAQQAGWDKEKRELKTKAQAVKVITRLVPTVGPLPEISGDELPADVRSKLPDSPGAGYTVVPDGAMVKIGQRFVQCDADAAHVVKCEADLDDTRRMVTAKEDQRAEWEKAAKGGSRWQRVKKVLLVTGAAAGGAAVGAQGPQKTQGAAIGAATGATLCALFCK
jgi:hypothetical protein